MLIIRKHPTLADPAREHAKDNCCSPRERLITPPYFASGEDHDALIVSENTTDIDPECRSRQFASSSEVAQHLLPPLIRAGDLAGARHMPCHVLVEHRGYRTLITASVERVLRIMELADELSV